MGSPLPVHVLCSCLFLCAIVPKGIHPSEHFLLPNRGNNMALSGVTGRVYVTTDNYMYRLNQTLGLEESVKTGPVSVGPCTPGLSCCEATNVNKILVVDDNQGQVLTCGVVRRGGCEIRLHTNISNATLNNFTFISPVHPQASAVAFLVTSGSNIYLAVGITNIRKDSRYSTPPCIDNQVNEQMIISVRNIKNAKLTPFLSYDFNFGEQLVTLEDLGMDLKFVDGFQAGTMIYMLLNINNSNPELVQMSVNNEQTRGIVQSFYQVSLTVKKLQLRLLSSALISLPGQLSYLATVFLHIDKDTPREFDSTLLYIYNLNSLKGKSPMKNSYFKIAGTEVRSSEPLQPNEETAVFVHPEMVSISAINVRNWTVFILGTANGQLIKLVMDNNMKVKSRMILFETKEETPLHRKVLFEPKTDPNYLYLMTDKEVIRLKVADCARYRSCQDCVSAQDPSCGWCNLHSRCSFESECENVVKSGNWISISEGKDSCLMINIKPSTIDYSFNNMKLFTVTVQGKVPDAATTGGEATCTLSRNKGLLCQSRYVNGCSCNVTTNQYSQLENQQDPIIVEALIQFSHFNLSKQVTLRNCYNIKTAQHNTPCSECSDVGCHWLAAKHQCTVNALQNPDQQFCPQVEKESYSPEGTELDVLLSHSALLKDANISLSCKFDETLSAGKWINNSAIRCNIPTFQEQRKIVSVNVVHTNHASNFIDNPKNITVHSCKSQNESCIFCPSGKQCEVSVIDSITPDRVSILETRTLKISGANLDVGAMAMLHIEDMSDGTKFTVNDCTIESSKLVTCELPITTKGLKKVCLLYDAEQYGNSCTSNRTSILTYISDVLITQIYPTVSWASGGRNITVTGRNLDVIDKLHMQTKELKITNDCLRYNNSAWICKSVPNRMNLCTVSFLIGNHSIKEFNLSYYADPTFYKFTEIHDTELVIMVKVKHSFSYNNNYYNNNNPRI
uniref:Plexin-C1-like n=1 Tax=Callorhinchus milii TaxID=7868 RepID=A0A4W3IJJ6_CALMI